MFMICTKDRINDGIIPSSLPLAYAMKGKSLSNVQLRFMINKLRNKLHEENIKVIAEVYDGQWQTTVMNSESGKPLNLLWLINSTWNKVSRMSKGKVLEDIMSCAKISNGDKDLIRLQRIPLGKKDFMNISITRLPSGALSCTSRGSRFFNIPVASFFVCVHPDDLKAFQNDIQSRKENTKKRQIGLKEDETSIINTLPAAMIEEFSDVLNGNTDLDDEDFLPDLGNNQTQLDKLLTHHNFKLLEQILAELQNHNEMKWNHWTVDDLFPNLLQNPHNLMKHCVVKDYEVIGRVLHSYTGWSFFSSSYNKAKNANIIGKAFESTDLVEEIHRNGKTVPQLNPLSLLDLCKNKILQNDYIVQSLHISYAQVLHMFQKGEYIQSSSINLKATIPRKMAGVTK